MEELDEASPVSSKMDHQDEVSDVVDGPDDGVVNIKLPEQLQKISPLDEFVSVRHRWNTNEEIASILIAFDRHKEWLVLPQKIRPASGSMLLYNRKVVFYRRDGYCWKKRRNGSTIREDHMKLKVQGLECIYGSYVHSAILPTFHRRCYWLLQNPNIVLIHYLNVPYPEAAKPCFPSLCYELSQKSWSKEELVDQLRPMLSRASEGTENDAEDDLKVEKMLDEILPILIPNQESSSTASSTTARPLAPAQSSLTSSYVVTAATSAASSLQQPVGRNKISALQSPSKVVVQSTKLDTDCYTLHKMNEEHAGFARLQPSLIPAHLINPSTLQQQLQAAVQIPTIHSFPSSCIQNSQGTLVATVASGQNLTATNDSQKRVHGGLAPSSSGSSNSNCSSFLNQTLINAGAVRFIAVGNNNILNPGIADRNENPYKNQPSQFGLHQTCVTSQVYPTFGTNVITSTSLAPTTFLTSCLTSSAADPERRSQTSETGVNHYTQNLDPQMNPQTQPVQYQLIAQPNHSFIQMASLEPHQPAKLLQVQQQASQTPPLLTFHLKPTSTPSSDVPGFLLSLQEASIVSQQGEQLTSGFLPTTNCNGSANLSSGQNLLFVASPTSGGFVLSRVASQPAPQTTMSSNSQQGGQQDSCLSPCPKKACSADSPYQEQQPHQQATSTQYSEPPVLDSLVFSQATSQPHSHQALPFLFSAVGNSIQPQASLPKQSRSLLQGADILTTTPENTFPLKIENSSFPIAFANLPFKEEFCAAKRECSGSSSQITPISMYSNSPCQPSMSVFGTAVLSQDSQPAFNWSMTKQQIQSQPPHQTQLTQPAAQSPQTQLSADLMAQTSVLSNSSVKDAIANPNSCDTLDGSFSSLPSTDLNIDDLLDLNDLDDVSDLGCSPFTNSGIGEQPVVNADMAEVGKDNDHGNVHEISLMLQSNDDPVEESICSMYQQPHSSHQQKATISLAHSLHAAAGDTLPSDILHLQSPAVAEPDLEVNSVIKDFSPGWAYTKLSTKILVAGPWCSKNSQYTCALDGKHSPASLVQPGLLRCFVQGSHPGYVTLQVARDGVVISNCEIFEFCDRESHDPSTSHPEWFALDSNQLTLLLIERLNLISQQSVHPPSPLQVAISDDLEALEQSLVHHVQMMMDRSWVDSNLYPKAGQHHLTLLHLAAGLGFAKLISCLIRWRMDNSCVALEFEVDAHSVDSHACTPLMWSCALGKIDAALTLYHWNSSPLQMCNKDGLLPLTLARQKGYYNLANQVEQLERAKQAQQHHQEQYQQQQQQQQRQRTKKPALDIYSMDLSSSPLATSQAGDPHGSKGLSFDQDKDEAESKDSLIEIHMSPSPVFSKPGKMCPKLIRRYSEQMLGHHHNRTLNKRNSVDLLPSGQDIDQVTLPSIGSPMSSPIREATSEPHLPVSPDMAFVAPPAPRLLLEDEIDEPAAYTGEISVSKMDTDELVAVHSPIIDVERISSDEEGDSSKDGSKHQMVTLANQIIAAIPERIKLSPSKADDDDASSGRGRSESHSSVPSQGSPRPSSFGDDSGISTPMTDSLAFEEYRYPEFGTPASSLSPDSTCLPSPYSPYSFTLDSPPPTTAEFTEYFNAPTTYMEKDFSQLTLSDQEQRKLYEAAKVIQNAYRHYRDKQQQQQQLQHQKEIEAAILIQSYYRRYKTYAYYKKMSHAAVLIQNQFRTYYAKRKKRGDGGVVTRRDLERLKKGRNQSVIIQQRFRSHYQRRSLDGKDDSSHGQGSSNTGESSPPALVETNSQLPDGTPAVDAEVEAPETVTGACPAPVNGKEDDDPSHATQDSDCLTVDFAGPASLSLTSATASLGAP